MALTFRQKESYAMSRLPPLTSDSTNEYSSEEDGEDVHLRLNHDEEVSEKLVNLSSCATGKLISDAEDEEEILFQKNPDLNFNNNISAKWTSKSATWGQSFRDWSNVFKAFIGSNYLGMPYAFAQSGVIAGCFGLLFIAGLTGHCCDLIVRCKKICVSRATEVAERAMQKECNGSVSENDLLTDVARKQRVKERAEKSITYGHVGRYAYGRIGEILVSIALIVTQVGFCVNYFIFVGNTVHTLFPAVAQSTNMLLEVNISHLAVDHKIRRRVPRFAADVSSPLRALNRSHTSNASSTPLLPLPTVHSSYSVLMNHIPAISSNLSLSSMINGSDSTNTVNTKVNPAPQILTSSSPLVDFDFHQEPVTMSPSTVALGNNDSGEPDQTDPLTSTSDIHNQTNPHLFSTSSNGSVFSVNMTNANEISSHTDTLFSSVKNPFTSTLLKPSSAASVTTSNLASTGFFGSGASLPLNSSHLGDSNSSSLYSVTSSTFHQLSSTSSTKGSARIQFSFSTVSHVIPISSSASIQSSIFTSSWPHSILSSQYVMPSMSPNHPSIKSHALASDTATVVSSLPSPDSNPAPSEPPSVDVSYTVASVASSDSNPATSDFPFIDVSTSVAWVSIPDSNTETTEAPLVDGSLITTPVSNPTIPNDSAIDLSVTVPKILIPGMKTSFYTPTTEATVTDADATTVSFHEAHTFADFAITSKLNASTQPVPSQTSVNFQKSNLPEITTAPPYIVLVLLQLPLQIGLSFFRDVRQLGMLSWIANSAIFTGCAAVFCFFFIDFAGIASGIMYLNLKTLPLFFGAASSAYEGIGTIIPIESSMSGNRHRYRRFLYSAILLVSIILGTFGISGYLCYGSSVEQVITKNLPSDLAIVKLLSVTLCIGILLTYPLQMFPIIETLEPLFFGRNRCFGPKESASSLSSTDSKTPLLDETDDESATVDGPAQAKHEVPNSVAPWKRNIFRGFLVSTTAVLAMFLQNYFFYVSALLGSVGSILLAYILPCFFHLCLCKGELNWTVWCKDVAIIIIGIVTGGLGLYSVIRTFLDNPHGFV